MQKIKTMEELNQMVSEKELVLLYVSSPNCSVCMADKPRAIALANELAVPMVEANAVDAPEIRGQFNLFTAPVIILFLKGREIYRAARIIDFEELRYRVNQVQEALR